MEGCVNKLAFVNVTPSSHVCNQINLNSLTQIFNRFLIVLKDTLIRSEQVLCVVITVHFVLFHFMCVKSLVTTCVYYSGDATTIYHLDTTYFTVATFVMRTKGVYYNELLYLYSFSNIRDSLS